MYKKYIFCLLLIGLGLNVFQGKSQESSTLYFLENIPQSNLLNPAMSPRCNVYVGLPGVNTIYTKFQTDISHKAFLQSSDSGNVSLISKYFDYNKFYRKVGKALTLKNYTLISPITFGFRGKSGYYTFSLSEKFKTNISFPTDIFSIIEDGLPKGSSVDLSRLGMNTQIYQEYAFGYSRNILSNVKVGARFKILQGFYSMKTNIKTFELNTNKDLWIFDLEGDVFTSAPLSVTADEDGLIDSIKISSEFEDMEAIDLVKNNLLDFSNRGFAFDFGAVYEYNQNLTFSASIIDLGYIRWRKDMNSFSFGSKQEFSGLELENLDSIGKALDNYLDSLDYFDASLGNQKYSTGLGTSVYLGGQYHVNHYFSAGILSRTSMDKNFFQQEFNLSANLNLYHFLTTNLSYNFSFSGEQYAGFGLGMNFFPLQFYLMLDNIPITFTRYQIDDGDSFPGPYDLRSFNIMVGFNIIIGSKGYQDRPKIDAYSEF